MNQNEGGVVRGAEQSHEYNRAVGTAVTSNPTDSSTSSLRSSKSAISRGIFGRKAILLPAALVFAVATMAYSAVWMYYIRLQPQVEIGFDPKVATSDSVEVLNVWPGSPAEQAGLKPHDRIVAINGKRLTAPDVGISSAWLYGRPGELVALAIERPGVAAPFTVRATFRAAAPTTTLPRRIAGQIMSAYPLFFLVIGLAVLLMRLEDQNAWLLALLFASFIAASDQPKAFASLPENVHRFALAYRAIFLSLIAPLFYFFFAVFPTCSPINRRLPWLKWLLLALGISFAVAGFRTGSPEPWPIMITMLAMGTKLARWSVLTFIYSSIFLGLASLVSNVVVAPSAEARRKLRIVLWGTAVGVTPIVLVHAVLDFGRVGPPFWLDFGTVVLLWFFPLSFAYAVVKHRVLEIPVLLKRSARYVFVRRGLVVFIALLAASLIALFTIVFSRFFPIGSKSAMAVGVVFGIALASASTPGLKRITQRIDRAFFRGAYDARLILQDLAQKTPRFNSRKDLAAELARRVEEALHPTWLAVYVEAGDYLEPEGEKPPESLKKIPKYFPLLRYLDRSGEPWDAYVDPHATAVLSMMFAPLEAECLVAFPARSGELLGLLVLGSRLSEEPYSGEDKMLLRSVASQAGVALENLRLAEEIAERLEEERNALRELEIARQVQSKLFPQTLPHMKTLEIAGTCSQARVVGGDYYDFVELGPGRLGLVLADVAGKGISAALLMANLQANLRSQYGLALKDQPRLLERVNRLFYENTEPNHYTTMFFGCYDDDSRRLVYANCGHNPPLLLRRDGSTEHLTATATVLGMFPEWQCQVNEVRLRPGDILALYSDGVTEATNENDEEFGEFGLQQALESGRNASASDLLSRLLEDVRQFGGGKQSDDVTVIIARAK